jgi:hypothetical protein
MVEDPRRGAPLRRSPRHKGLRCTLHDNGTSSGVPAPGIARGRPRGRERTAMVFRLFGAFAPGDCEAAPIGAETILGRARSRFFRE